MYQNKECLINFSLKKKQKNQQTIKKYHDPKINIS